MLTLTSLLRPPASALDPLPLLHDPFVNIPSFLEFQEYFLLLLQMPHRQCRSSSPRTMSCLFGACQGPTTTSFSRESVTIILEPTLCGKPFV